MCGIQIGSENEYMIKPKIGGNMNQASCEYNGVYGKVKSEWRKNVDSITYRITVPANVFVKAILPNGEHVCGAGVHEFTVLKWAMTAVLKTENRRRVLCGYGILLK